MPHDTNTHPFVLAAVKRLYPQLPALVGADVWTQLQPQLDAHLTTLESQPDAYLAQTQLSGLLWQYEPAHQRLSQELIIQQTVIANLQAHLPAGTDDAHLAAMLSAVAWEVDAATVPSAQEAEKDVRAITMKAGGADGGRSIKFRNLDLDLGKMMTVGAGFLLAGQDMLDTPSPFVIAGGILVMVGTLLSEMTVKIEQQEATVFWGMIQATGTMHGAGLREQIIFEVTNAERAKYGLDALTEPQVRASLHKLEQLRSIEKSDDTYRIIERYTVKG